ncbi:MAG: hypothetical protein OXG62_14820 [Nitrospinae bacterium]|nr:hypothetical protein [Nitrospinota bacterium]
MAAFMQGAGDVGSGGSIAWGWSDGGEERNPIHSPLEGSGFPRGKPDEKPLQSGLSAVIPANAGIQSRLGWKIYGNMANQRRWPGSTNSGFHIGSGFRHPPE